MRKLKEDYARVNSVIQADKSVMSEGCKMLVLQDFAKKFEEYFDLSTPPEMEIVFFKGGYDVKINFRAERVKKFNVLK